MPTPIPPEASRAFASLAELVYSGSSSDDVLAAICRLAVDLIPGADHVSISSLGEGKVLLTRASSDDIAAQMDVLESLAGEGPCLDSILEDSVQRDEDITTTTTWPALAELTLARTPVRGMLGYRLQEGLGGRSALNVFSDTPGALTTDALDAGAALAAFTSIALAAAEQRATAQQLRQGLESNREIGKAVGLLMAAHSVDDAAAFEILRTASSRTNTKLSVLAERITHSHREQLHGAPHDPEEEPDAPE